MSRVCRYRCCNHCPRHLSILVCIVLYRYDLDRSRHKREPKILSTWICSRACFIRSAEPMMFRAWFSQRWCWISPFLARSGAHFSVHPGSSGCCGVSKDDISACIFADLYDQDRFGLGWKSVMWLEFSRLSLRFLVLNVWDTESHRSSTKLSVSSLLVGDAVWAN